MTGLGLELMSATPLDSTLGLLNSAPAIPSAASAAHVGGGSGVANRPTSTISRITLSCDKGSPLGFAAVTLAINPEKMTLAKQTSVQGGSNLVASDFENAIKQSGNLTVTLSGIRLVGSPYTATTIHTLIALATPWPMNSELKPPGRSPGLVTVSGIGNSSGTSMSGVGAAISDLTQIPGSTGRGVATQEMRLPKVMLNWGDGLSYPVTVVNVNVDITRVSPTGLPISATVTSLILKVVPEQLPGTNPTSGGRAGRGTHVIVAGDSIVRIAVRNYGDPAAWRAIAVANGLDDPLRLAVGQQLYLPGPDEIDEFELTGRADEVIAV